VPITVTRAIIITSTITPMVEAVSANHALLGLMRLVSPALPVGGFAYSQGLEYAVDCGWVTDADQTRRWLQGVIGNGLAKLDVPLLVRLYHSFDDPLAFADWNARVFASRETRELRQEEQLMGRALWRLLSDLKEPLPALAKPSWLAAFVVAARRWGLDCEQTCLGFLWSWMENQLAVSAKTVPIGQTDVQRISAELLDRLTQAVAEGMTLADEDISGGLPGMIMASMKHETQYSRLFRS
jgi:urease accessory protein